MLSVNNCARVNTKRRLAFGCFIFFGVSFFFVNVFVMVASYKNRNNLKFFLINIPSFVMLFVGLVIFITDDKTKAPEKIANIKDDEHAIEAPKEPQSITVSQVIEEFPITDDDSDNNDLPTKNNATQKAAALVTIITEAKSNAINGLKVGAQHCMDKILGSTSNNPDNTAEAQNTTNFVQEAIIVEQKNEDNPNLVKTVQNNCYKMANSAIEVYNNATKVINDGIANIKSSIPTVKMAKFNPAIPPIKEEDYEGEHQIHEKIEAPPMAANIEQNAEGHKHDAEIQANQVDKQRETLELLLAKIKHITYMWKSNKYPNLETFKANHNDEVENCLNEFLNFCDKSNKYLLQSLAIFLIENYEKSLFEIDKVDNIKIINIFLKTLKQSIEYNDNVVNDELKNAASKNDKFVWFILTCKDENNKKALFSLITPEAVICYLNTVIIKSSNDDTNFIYVTSLTGSFKKLQDNTEDCYSIINKIIENENIKQHLIRKLQTFFTEENLEKNKRNKRIKIVCAFIAIFPAVLDFCWQDDKTVRQSLEEQFFDDEKVKIALDNASSIKNTIVHQILPLNETAFTM